MGEGNLIILTIYIMYTCIYNKKKKCAEGEVALKPNNG
jgi:hypothetical protein